MDPPLSIDIEFGGNLEGAISVEVKNNSSDFFPAPSKTSFGSGVHLLIKDLTDNTEKLLYWGESPYGNPDSNPGLAPGQHLSALIPLTPSDNYPQSNTILRDDYELKPNKTYEISVGYGYLKDVTPTSGFLVPFFLHGDFPIQRLIGLELTTDSNLNFEITATEKTHTEFKPGSSSSSKSPTEAAKTSPATFKLKSNSLQLPIQAPHPIQPQPPPSSFSTEIILIALTILIALAAFLIRRKVRHQ